MSQAYEQLSATERKSLSDLAAQKSRLALQRADRRQARRYAEQAAALDPQNEDAWLLLGALASPKASVDYLERALKVNPASQRARKGLEWAQERLKDSQTDTVDHPSAAASRSPARQGARIAAVQTQKRTANSIPVAARPRRTQVPFLFYYAIATIAVSVLLFAVSLIPYYPEMVAYFSLDLFFQAPVPATVAAYLPAIPANASQTPDRSPEAAAAAASPSPTPTALQPATATPIPTETALPSPTPTVQPTDTALPTPSATLEPTPLPSATLAPPTLVPQPAPTKKPKKKAVAGPGYRPQNVSLNDRWIDVDLSAQTTYAMQGDQVVRSFVVSTGRWPTVTVEGVFKIYVKYRTANMSGDDYFLPNVPYVMYFFKGYGIHGTYWHNNFGTPMSHGCVNLRPEDAGWLFDFASVNTIVNVHP